MPAGSLEHVPRSIAPTSVFDVEVRSKGASNPALTAQDVSVVSHDSSSGASSTRAASLPRASPPPPPATDPRRPTLFVLLTFLVTSLHGLVQSLLLVAGFLVALIALVVPFGDVFVPTPAPVPAHAVEPESIRAADALPSGGPTTTLPIPREMLRAALIGAMIICGARLGQVLGRKWRRDVVSPEVRARLSRAASDALLSARCAQSVLSSTHSLASDRRPRICCSTMNSV